jgi:tetratricopeptide (TPR) repeat protein
MPGKNKKREIYYLNNNKNLKHIQSPSNIEVNDLLEYYQKGQLALAESLAKAIIHKYPDYQFSYKVLGVLFKQTGRVKESLIANQRAVELSPNDAEVHCNLGNTLKELGRLKDAEACYRKAISINPDYAEIHYNLGITQQIFGRLEDAEVSYKKAIAIKPDYAEAYNNLGVTLRELGKLEDAEACYKKAIAIKPDYAEAYNNLGVTLKELGKLEDAEACYKNAIAIKLDYAEAHSNLGFTLQELGRLQEAEKSYKKAITIKPDYAEAHSNLGNTLQELGRLQDAEKCHKKAIAIEPDLAEAHSNLGVTLQELGRLEDAETSYKKAIAIKPDYAEAFSNLSQAFLFLDKLNEATQVLLKIIEIDPEGYGLRACVDLAILNFLNGNRSSSKSFLLKSKSILWNKKFAFKNQVAYWKYLSILLVEKQNEIEKETDKLEIQKLFVIGESHSLASHETYIKIIQSHYVCQSFWIAGCKQWHIGNNQPNQYKEKLRRVIDSVPDESKILLSIGEIDCRLNEGILKHIRNYPENSQSELIQSTVENYLNYVHQLTIPKSLDVIIQGVPCPNIKTNNVKQSDLLQLINLIREFNKVLQDGAKKRDFNFLDLHKMTDRGDGFSNGLWHIDQHHLSPAGMIEAWRRHFE